MSFSPLTQKQNEEEALRAKLVQGIAESRKEIEEDWRPGDEELVARMMEAEHAVSLDALCNLYVEGMWQSALRSAMRRQGSSAAQGSAGK